jgi:Spy/CpxP family protein refolding chaperone
MHWWKEAQHRGSWAGGGGHHHEPPDDDMQVDGGFGVRRPLRFMAHRLELDERQVAELAGLLTSLKTERAQAAVDQRRSVAAFADVSAADTFDVEAARKAAELRVMSAARLRDAVVETLHKTHAMLRSDQRQKLAFLLRSGQLTI